LTKLKEDLKEKGHFVEERMNDAMLLRFLRARKFDFTKAKEMLLSAEKWRKDFKVDEIVKNFEFREKEEVDKYYPQYYHKMDKEGRPLYIECIGNLNMKALNAVTTTERQLQRLVLEYEISLTERLRACSISIGHPVETFCTILDLGGVSLSNFYGVKDYISAAASIGQDRYPETMGTFYIINASWAFSAIWAMIRPWLDEVTAAKIQIVGAGYKELLLKQIPKENLPKWFGGECECVGGCSLSDAGPWNTDGGKEKS
jgi:hypothetical protein